MLVDPSWSCNVVVRDAEPTNLALDSAFALPISSACRLPRCLVAVWIQREDPPSLEREALQREPLIVVAHGSPPGGDTSLARRGRGGLFLEGKLFISQEGGDTFGIGWLRIRGIMSLGDTSSNLRSSCNCCIARDRLPPSTHRCKPP